MQQREQLKEEMVKYHKACAVDIKVKFNVELLKRVKPNITFCEETLIRDLTKANGRIDLISLSYTCNKCGEHYTRRLLRVMRVSKCAGCSLKSKA